MATNNGPSDLLQNTLQYTLEGAREKMEDTRKIYPAVNAIIDEVVEVFNEYHLEYPFENQDDIDKFKEMIPELWQAMTEARMAHEKATRMVFDFWDTACEVTGWA